MHAANGGQVGGTVKLKLTDAALKIFFSVDDVDCAGK